MTKILGIILTSCLIVSICVGAANLITSLRRDIDRVEAQHFRHEVSDEKKFEELYSDVEDAEDAIDALEKCEIARGAEYSTLRRDLSKLEETLSKELDKISVHLERLERAE